MKSLTDFIAIEDEYDCDSKAFGCLMLADPLGEKQKFKAFMYDELYVIQDAVNHLKEWIARYEQYRAAHNQPPCPWQIDSAVYRYPESRRDQRYYVIRHTERGTFLHTDGMERTLTHHDNKPTGIYETREAAEATLLEGWYNVEQTSDSSVKDNR